MNLLWLILIIPAALFSVLFTIYFFNLDMKLVAVIYQALGRRFDKQKKETNF